MNYLAHAYLSFEDPEVLTGNMISDFVKGKRKYDFPSRILAGINLHREIDAFTDVNSITKEAASLFKPAYGAYALPFMDVVYDHFLALELQGQGNDFLLRFSASTYNMIGMYEDLLPEAFKNMFPYMRQQNWLYNYQFTDGIGKSFGGLVQRAKYLSDSAAAIRIFEENYETFKLAYDDFFPDLLDFSLRKFADIH